MTLPDFVNGAFEACGGFFIALSVVKLHRERVVKGVSWAHAGFFSAWGFWNLFYYPHLGQWLSFWGGLFLVATNAVWLGQIIYYNHRNRTRPVVPVEMVEYPATMEADQFGGFDRPAQRRYRHIDK